MLVDLVFNPESRENSREFTYFLLCRCGCLFMCVCVCRLPLAIPRCRLTIFAVFELNGALFVAGGRKASKLKAEWWLTAAKAKNACNFQAKSAKAQIS